MEKSTILATVGHWKERLYYQVPESQQLCTRRPSGKQKGLSSTSELPNYLAKYWANISLNVVQ